MFPRGRGTNTLSVFLHLDIPGSVLMVRTSEASVV